MTDYFQQVQPDIDPSGEALPIDSAARFTKAASTDPLAPEAIVVTCVGTGIVCAILSPEVFEAKYAPVENTEPTAPAQIPVQAADGTQFILTVNPDGSVTGSVA